MNRARWLPWFLLAVWSTWISALQGLALERPELAPWVPDAGLVLLLALASRLERADLSAVALTVALGRLAVSVESPPAVLAAALATALVVGGLRSVVEIGEPLARSAIAFALALAWARWHAYALESRAFADAALFAGSLEESWRAVRGALGPHALSRAAATAALALAFGPALAHLPGLTPLRRKRTWHAAASARSW
jgi:hypothetical protein